MTRALAVTVVGLLAGPASGQVGFRAGFGFPYRYGPPFFPPPPLVVVVTPPPVYQPSAEAVIRAMFPPSDDVVALSRRPARPVDPADFRVIRPQQQMLPPVRPAAPAAPDPGPVPKDPKQATVFHVAAAKEAFLDGQYGRATERLNDAVAADPGDPLAYFLLAQVRTARGEYGEAVAAIRDGMKRAPDWPASGFRLRELYGPAGGLFDAHLAELRQAAIDRPADPTLAFLVGYHLWFLGDRAEAAKLFRQAAGAVRDGGVVERFLVEADGAKT